MSCRATALSITGETIQLEAGGTYVIEEGCECPVPAQPNKPVVPSSSCCGDDTIQVDTCYGGASQATPGTSSGCCSPCQGLPIKASPCEEVYIDPDDPGTVCTLPLVCERTDALIQDVERIEGEIATIDGQITTIEGEIAHILANCCAPSGDGSILVVDDVEALRALDVSTLTGIKYIKVLGYWSISDGGDFECYYDATSTATVDNGIVFQPTVGAGRFILLGF